jgi:hypothetical protein
LAPNMLRGPVNRRIFAMLMRGSIVRHRNSAALQTPPQPQARTPRA